MFVVVPESAMPEYCPYCHKVEPSDARERAMQKFTDAFGGSEGFVDLTGEDRHDVSGRYVDLTKMKAAPPKKIKDILKYFE